MNELIVIAQIRQFAIDWFELYIPWSRDCDPDIRKQHNHARNQAFEDAKEAYRALIYTWARNHGISEAQVRSEFRIRFTGRYQTFDGVKIEPGMTSIHNGLNGLGNSLWLNKVSISQEGAIVSAKATTDPMFLEPFPTQFREWLAHVNAKLMEPIRVGG